jgi:hypothetical protein
VALLLAEGEGVTGAGLDDPGVQGIVTFILVPALFAGILGLLFSYARAERYFPFVLVTLVVPIGLVIWPRTRRFGLYLLIGMVTTAIVVGGVAAIVLWYLVTRQG